MFSDDYEPTVLDIFKGPRAFEGKQITLEIHDTSGDEHLGVNRAVSYNGADCFMLCVAVNNRTSLENVEKWMTEIKQIRPDAPILLVGTKSDLQGPVTEANLRAKMQERGLTGVCLTSSKEYHDHNVNKAFQTAIRTGFYSKYPHLL